MKTRIAVLVSGGGTNLQALLDAQTAGRIPHGEIALVVSNHAGAYALERAKGAGVPAAVVSKKECGSQAAFEHRLQGILELNIHPSLIPAFCGEGFYGLHVHEAALSRGVKVTGATVHFVNEIPDGGPILLQKAVEVLPEDTPETLQRRVMEQAEWILLPQAAELVARQIATSPSNTR